MLAFLRCSLSRQTVYGSWRFKIESTNFSLLLFRGSSTTCPQATWLGPSTASSQNHFVPRQTFEKMALSPWPVPTWRQYTLTQPAFSGVLAQPLGGLNIDDDDHKKEDFPKEKTKTKTRGTPAPRTSNSPQIPDIEQEERSPVHIIQVDTGAPTKSSMYSFTQPRPCPNREKCHGPSSCTPCDAPAYGWKSCTGRSGSSRRAATTVSVLRQACGASCSTNRTRTPGFHSGIRGGMEST